MTPTEKLLAEQEKIVAERGYYIRPVRMANLMKAASRIFDILLNFEFMESNEETAPEIPTADSYQISVQVNGGEIYQRSE